MKQTELDITTTTPPGTNIVTMSPPGLPAIPEGPGSITDLLRLAIDKGTSVEALEKLVTLHERVSDRMAAQEFAGALADFQSECPSIARTSTAEIATNSGAKFRYQYAELDEIARTIGPLLHARGLSFTWDCTVAANLLTCVCTLRHVNGHKITASFTVPTDSKAGMSEAQKVAAALTFARRQSLVSVLGLTTTDPDPDGADGHGTEKITDKQAADLRALIQEVGADERKFLKVYGAARVDDLLAANYSAAIGMLEGKRK